MLHTAYDYGLVYVSYMYLSPFPIPGLSVESHQRVRFGQEITLHEFLARDAELHLRTRHRITSSRGRISS